jgi:FkbM family methyltransferase
MESSLRLWWWNTAFNALARLSPGRATPRTFSRQGELWRVQFADGRVLCFVAARRMRLYGRGLDMRLLRVASRYGAESAFSIDPGQVVVDVGANIGEFSLYAAGRGAAVYAVEPDRLNLAALERNVAEVPAVRVVPVACAEAAGEAVLYAYPEGADSSLIEPARYSGKYRVRTERLDELVERWGLDRIDLLKCDAEGAEPEVLRGAAGILGRVARVSVDVSPERQGASTAAECRQILDAAGFRVRPWHKGRILIGERP